MDANLLSVVIENGETVSGALKLPATYYPAALMLPAITTSTAIIFHVSMDGVNYYPLHDGAGAAYSVTINNTVTNAVALDPTKFYPWEYIKVAVANAQSGDKTIGIIVRTY